MTGPVTQMLEATRGLPPDEVARRLKAYDDLIEAFRAITDPGPTLQGQGVNVHPSCETQLSIVVQSLFLHIAGACDPATCPGGEHHQEG